MKEKINSKVSRNVRIMRVYFHRLFPKRQPRHNVAFSIFLGIFIGLMPTIGFALVLTFAACRLFRVRALPGMIASFIAIPPTLFLFFYPAGYALGLVMVDPASIDFDFLNVVSDVSLANVTEIVNLLWGSAKGHLLSFVLGMFIVAFGTALIGYGIAFYIMDFRRRELDKKRNLRKLKV
jgi:uncharacterized protein (DUF2062 family)